MNPYDNPVLSGYATAVVIGVLVVLGAFRIIPLRASVYGGLAVVAAVLIWGFALELSDSRGKGGEP